MIVEIVYGLDIASAKDRLSEIVDGTSVQFNDMSRPGAYIVDSFPILRCIPSWFPGGTFHKEAEIAKKSLIDLINVPVQMVAEQMVCDLIISRHPQPEHHMQKAGVAPVSYVSNLLSAEDYNPGQDWTIKRSAASAYGGGADTVCQTLSLIGSFWSSHTQRRSDYRTSARFLPAYAAVA